MKKIKNLLAKIKLYFKLRKIKKKISKHDPFIYK